MFKIFIDIGNNNGRDLPVTPSSFSEKRRKFETIQLNCVWLHPQFIYGEMHKLREERGERTNQQRLDRR
jgi:hypothetical protein